MSTHDRWLPLVLVAALSASPAMADESPRLGVELSKQEVAAVSFTVMTDGEGLPAGSGTAAKGEAVYLDNCLACHGEEGADGVNDRLVGGLGTIRSERPVKTVGSYWPYATTLFDYVRRAMPFQTPGSLSADETYAVTAYVLYLNGIVEVDEVIDAESLPRIEMPNRENFTWAHTPD
jgi:cytochrome c